MKKEILPDSIVKTNKELTVKSKNMQKNIDLVIKYFNQEDNIRNFFEETLLGKKKYSPDLSHKAKHQILEEVNKILDNDTLQILIRDVVISVVSKIAYEEFQKRKDELRSEYIDNLNEDF